MYGIRKPSAEMDANHYTYKQWFQDVYRFIFSKTNITSITSAYTVVTDVYYIRVDTTSGGVTITLPTAVDSAGRELVIKKINAGANNVTIDGYSSETIDGSASIVFNTQYENYTLISNGTNWEKI